MVMVNIQIKLFSYLHGSAVAETAVVQIWQETSLAFS